MYVGVLIKYYNLLFFSRSLGQSLPPTLEKLKWRFCLSAYCTYTFFKMDCICSHYQMPSVKRSVSLLYIRASEVFKRRSKMPLPPECVRPARRGTNPNTTISSWVRFNINLTRSLTWIDSKKYSANHEQLRGSSGDACGRQSWPDKDEHVTE